MVALAGTVFTYYTLWVVVLVSFSTWISLYLWSLSSISVSLTRHPEMTQTCIIYFCSHLWKLTISFIISFCRGYTLSPSPSQLAAYCLHALVRFPQIILLCFEYHCLVKEIPYTVQEICYRNFPFTMRTITDATWLK